MKNPVVTVSNLAVIAVAAAIFVLPAPEGWSPKLFEAGALAVLIVGFWALGTMPEHIVGLLFFLLAMLFAIAPASVVFSGFASGTLWLVLGGLIIAEAVNETGLAERFARFLIGRYTLSYRTLIAATVLVSTALCFVMPATVSRILLLLPIMAVVAQRLGLQRGSKGHNGVALAVIMTNAQVGTSILPANAPNLVLAGAAETLYSTPLIYGEWLLVRFPVMDVLKCLLIIGFIWLLFPDETSAQAEAAPAHGPMSRAERRLTAILLVALALWGDGLHTSRSSRLDRARRGTCHARADRRRDACYCFRRAGEVRAVLLYRGDTRPGGGDGAHRIEHRARRRRAGEPQAAERGRCDELRDSDALVDVHWRHRDERRSTGAACASGESFCGSGRLAPESRVDDHSPRLFDDDIAVSSAAGGGGDADGGIETAYGHAAHLAARTCELAGAVAARFLVVARDRLLRGR